jgi:SAM-dependent methyltransferase
MTSSERWLAALWPTVRGHLPDSPATVVELGCGKFGGLVPRLRQDGYEAIGIDPEGPDGEDYRRVEFERCQMPVPLDGAIACTSLHHVADPGEVVAQIADALAPTGVVIIVEWDWERFDEPTARWCSDRAADGSWLQRRLEGWRASGQPWEDYFRSWAEEHGIHSARELLDRLDGRFERVACQHGPFLFADLDEVGEAEERAAIDSGAIRAMRVDYVGRLAGR